MTRSAWQKREKIKEKEGGQKKTEDKMQNNVHKRLIQLVVGFLVLGFVGLLSVAIARDARIICLCLVIDDGCAWLLLFAV